ncbi:MAG: tetratricopeptide repeat protein, partial [Planctomycetes bacterium]|nr:tetratricopeptide repeat protein [Planctomycetota bacterium]
FYTMKLVRGKTMAHRLLQIQNSNAAPQQKLAERLKLLDAFTDVCNAVAYAHSRGVIHRDLKPANIMLGEFGETLVLDWGLARVRGQEDSSGVRRKAEKQAFSPSLLKDDTSGGTLDGAILGTPAYMPPEQARGELDKVDERADVYALGAMLYEVLSGVPPFEGSNARDVLAKVLVLKPESLQKIAPHAPPDLVSLVEKAMARDPEQRLKSADALAREVLAFRDGRTLSVYRYSTAELLKRFVGRHKAAVAVAVVAVLLGVAGGVYAFEQVADERDQAELNLQAATREREARFAAELKHQDDREKLIDAREVEIDRQRHRLDGLRGDDLTGEAHGRIDQLRTRGTPDGGLPPADRAENSRIVSGLLAAAGARNELIRLMTAPVAGQSHEFVPENVLASERDRLRETRVLAAELAMLNEDFALADFIIEGTDSRGDEHEGWLKRIDDARSALLARHRTAIEEALDDVRNGLARTERPRGNLRLEDYVIRLSAYREPQTVELLSAALQPYIDRAKQQGRKAFWIQVERDEIILILRTLGYLELPDLTVPELVAFMEHIDDERLAIECATALCQSSSAAAYAPLLKARDRFGAGSYVWHRVQRWFNRVPEPADLPEPATAEEFVERARNRRERHDSDGAMLDVEQALKLDPDNVVAMVLKARILAPQQAVPVCERALELDPGYTPALALLANGYYQTGKVGKAIEVALKAIEQEPDEAPHYLNAGFYYFMDKQYDAALEQFNTAARKDPRLGLTYTNRAAIYILRKQYDEAAADLSRAIDLDPRQVENWVNRGSARMENGDLFGALEDANRALEILPNYTWGWDLRAQVYVKMERYEEALDDLNHLLPTFAPGFRDAYRRRAEIRLKLDDSQGALDDYRAYLKLNPDAEDKPEVEAKISELEK